MSKAKAEEAGATVPAPSEAQADSEAATEPSTSTAAVVKPPLSNGKAPSTGSLSEPESATGSRSSATAPPPAGEHFPRQIQLTLFYPRDDAAGGLSLHFVKMQGLRMTGDPNQSSLLFVEPSLTKLLENKALLQRGDPPPRAPSECQNPRPRVEAWGSKR